MGVHLRTLCRLRRMLLALQSQPCKHLAVGTISVGLQIDNSYVVLNWLADAMLVRVKKRYPVATNLTHHSA